MGETSSKINIAGVVRNIRSKYNIYTPIIEAIVNAVDSIRSTNRSDGKVTVKLIREQTLDIGDIAGIKEIEIVDNGAGFNKENRDSFDTFYSELKYKLGGKGFGRFLFLKYFKSVHVSSVYRYNNLEFHLREFRFGRELNIIVDEKDEVVKATDCETHVFLADLFDDQKIDKGIETVARKLLEKLLILFVDGNFQCPIIEVKDDETSIILNNYFNSKNADIQQIYSDAFNVPIELDHSIKKFEVKVFKIYYANTLRSMICLTANGREVTETSLHEYIPEFADDFYDEETSTENEKVTHKQRNYIIRVYVVGNYLNKNVSVERETFNFEKDKETDLFPISQCTIERCVSEIVEKLLSSEVRVRRDKKMEIITNYVNRESPWNKILLKDLSVNDLPFNPSPEQIEIAFQRVKFKNESSTRTAVKEVLDADDKDFEQKLGEITDKISAIGKDDLAHYVCSRRAILDLFKRLLRRSEDNSINTEKEFHNIIFPMSKDSTNVEYEQHNLWMIDERLVFSEYIASDKKISKNTSLGRPDIAIFGNRNSFRMGDNEFSNPLTIVEFKRPKRTDYNLNDDPIEQIYNYVVAIREGKYEMPDGISNIKVNDVTPVLGYVICDPCKKIDDFALKHQFTRSPDKEGYYGFHAGYKIYYEIISYRKLIDDAELRNKILFHKLRIDS